MKTYIEPETNVLQVIHSCVICTVSPDDPTSNLGTMDNSSVQMGIMGNIEIDSY